jgi:hypothetical protein
MQDPKKRNEPETPHAPAAPDETAPKPGGFGAFAEVYRTRWAASHPNMRPREYTKQSPNGTADTAQSEPSPDALHTEDGTRVFHPKDPS